jgi:hypothetical protein
MEYENWGFTGMEKLGMTSEERNVNRSEYQP